MKNYEYYKELAETIFFDGIDSLTLLQIGKYKTGKTFNDIVNAINRGRLDGLGRCENELGCIADRLSEVLDIDTSQPLREYKQKLAKLVQDYKSKN